MHNAYPKRRSVVCDDYIQGEATMTDHRTPSPSRWSGLQVSLLGIVGSFVGSHVFIEEAVVPGVDFL
jgi:hypothetical protein